ncbi:MAG: hypothetical protein LBF28_01160 [Rickettsiales bacterium]|jgi:tRNA (guanine-N7-)-methyltransferase|nr:hypothetical protein [Rickettsiales bacterium]
MENTAKTFAIRTFGRIRGKKLSARQQWLVDNLLPELRPESNKETGGQFILEIGFGAGEHLRELAARNPEHIIIGAEPFINGVASLLSAMTNESDNSIKTEYQNIRIWPDDVRKLLSGSDLRFTQIWILHPDPWPKARHEKRRLLSAEFLNLLYPRLAAAGRIIIGTDHWEYFDWIMGQAANTKLKSEVRNQKSKIIPTRYQQKNKAETDAPKYLILTNKNRPACMISAKN